MTPTKTIAARVREIRERRSLTAQAVADQLRDLGIPWERSTVAKLENGTRENVTVSELLGLAVVLNVAPVHLLVPLADDAPYQVTPTGEHAQQSAAQIRDWVRGHGYLPGADLRAFWSEIPEAEFKQQFTFAQPAPVPKELLEEGDENGPSS